MSAGVLSGIKVVDFTHIFAGPFAAQILGDLGADIVKVERIDGGDASRYYGLTDHVGSMSGSFLAFNRNKRSIAVDLSQTAGHEIVRELIDSADVVIENFSEGVMRRWEFDYLSLAVVHPALVYCSISGFGRVGDLSNKAANDVVIQAYSGLLSITGEPDRPPVRCGTAISDLSAGLYAALGVLSALFHRARTGVGQLVETSLLESQISLMGYLFADYWLHGVVPQPMGTANGLGLPNQAFPSSDGYVVIAAANNRMWQRCCDGLGLSDLASDPRFATLPDRYENRVELVALISERTMQMTTRDCVVALESLGVSCSPINSIADVANDEQLHALGAILEVGTEGGPLQKVIGSPIHLSNTPTTTHQPVPQLGGSTLEILSELGYSVAQIEKLIADHTIGIPPNTR
jgi:crotonobetainyl-CoA:carnitine CoA-transferase CaiB-like acyl-CoA transferase